MTRMLSPRRWYVRAVQSCVPIADRPWGKREGRVQDPFGHLWVFSKQIEDVTAEEIARRLLS